MFTTEKMEPVILPEFEARDLGIPFKVLLIDSVKEIRNPSTGEVEKTIIPNITGLMKCAAITRIAVPRKLCGPEIKFIRKALKVSAKSLAEKIGVTPEHLSRCEAGERVLSTGAEKCLRISVLMDKLTITDKMNKVCEKNEKAADLLIKLKKALSEIEGILSDMPITSAHDIEDELVFHFSIANKSSEDLFKEDLDADWSANGSALSIAA